MTQETYDGHKETLESGKIVVIGGRTATSVDELDMLRKHLPIVEGEDTGRTAENRQVAEDERTAAGEALPSADSASQATAGQIATGARDDVSPKTLHDNATGEDVIAEADIDPQAGGTGDDGSENVLSVKPETKTGNGRSRAE